MRGPTPYRAIVDIKRDTQCEVLRTFLVQSKGFINEAVIAIIIPIYGCNNRGPGRPVGVWESHMIPKLMLYSASPVFR